MDTRISDEDKQDRTVRALQVVAISGFMKSVCGIQDSCLSLCHTCRDNIPVQCLTISRYSPPSIQALVYPGLNQANTAGSPRVLPPQSVRIVYWTCEGPSIVESPSSTDHSVSEEDGTQEAEMRGRSVDWLETDIWREGNLDISRIHWPEGTREISWCFVNRRMDPVK